ncbi:unnamed protein product, partial [marine sediment metagenome]
LFENTLNSQNGETVYSTIVVGKLRARGGFYKFRLEFANFDYEKHYVSWEIYHWQD